MEIGDLFLYCDPDYTGTMSRYGASRIPLGASTHVSISTPPIPHTPSGEEREEVKQRDKH